MKKITKNFKRIASVILALAMVFAMTISAFAAETPPTYSISVSDGDAHTYQVYQIFTGDLSEEDGTKVLSNLKWGLNGTIKSGEVSETVKKALEDVNNVSDREKLNVITQYVDFTSDAIATVKKNSPYTNAAPGYYLLKTEDSSVSDNDVFSTYIVKIVSSVSVSSKSDVPEVEKKVKDTNDSTNTTTEWQDSADYDIGDTISFKLTGTLPDNYVDYIKYHLVFNDTMTNMSDVTITSAYLTDASGTTVKSFATSDYTSTSDNGNLTISFADLKTSSINADIANSYKVVVEYTAKLTDSAVSGSAGNANEVTITYTNDPNWDGTGTDEPTGTTPKDKVVVFTYTLIINKVDENSKALVGAGFTLQKKGTDGEYANVGGEIDGTALSTFTWSGLDDGDYQLVETTTPAGYNTIDPIKFTITAVHDTSSEDPKLTELSTTFKNATTNLTAGSITGTVQNQKGASLPETGGMGTTVFYIVGAVLVLGAAVLLINRRRMNAAE